MNIENNRFFTKKTTLIVILLLNFIFFSQFLYAKDTVEEAKGYVVMLHGIARSNNHMEKLENYLQDKQFKVININYPSTDYEIEKLIDIIQRNISKDVPKNQKIHFVGYSMGGLLVRGIINKYRPKKLGRVVLLAPPNHGSEVADFLEDNWLYNKIYGLAGKQLTTKHSGKIKKIFGEIDYEVGVIAGNFTIDPISSYIIPGDDDGKVSIKSTKINGMKDHIIVSASHTFFPSNQDVKEQTFYFLKNGKFNHN